MEALVGRMKSLSTIVALFRILFLVWGFVLCLSAAPLIPPASKKYDDGRLVRALFVFEAPKRKTSPFPCGHAVAVLNKVNIRPYRCISHVGSVSNWQCEDSHSVGEDVPDAVPLCRWHRHERMGFRRMPSAWERPQGHPASGSTPDGPGAIPGRRPTARFEHEAFHGRRNNGFTKTQAGRQCTQSGHKANICRIELVDRARG